MDFSHEVRFSAGIGPAHFPAETTRPLGRGCLPFSPLSFRFVEKLAAKIECYAKTCKILGYSAGFCDEWPKMMG